MRSASFLIQPGLAKGFGAGLPGTRRVGFGLHHGTPLLPRTKAGGSIDGRRAVFARRAQDWYWMLSCGFLLRAGGRLRRTADFRGHNRRASRCFVAIRAMDRPAPRCTSARLSQWPLRAAALAPAARRSLLWRIAWIVLIVIALVEVVLWLRGGPSSSGSRRRRRYRATGAPAGPAASVVLATAGPRRYSHPAERSRHRGAARHRHRQARRSAAC